MPNDGSNLTVKGQFSQLLRQYEGGVLRGMPAEETDALARTLIPQFELLWRQMAVVGIMSPNEHLDELSTNSLELLWTPYIIADLYQRVQGPMPTPGVVSSSALAPSSATGMTREEALTASKRWCDVFFQWMLDYELVDEQTLEKYRSLSSEQRTQRLELSRKRRELEEEKHRYEEQVQYLLAKRKHMGALMEADDDEFEDTNCDEEEALRNRALSRLRWSIYECCSSWQLSSRELEMLQALSPEQRQAISIEHQNTLEAVQRGEKSLGRHTYTILPGGLITPGGPIPTAQLSSVAMSAIASQQDFRQRVVDELMLERNAPTMTLQEFAEAEMADVQRRMDASAAAQRQQAEEDERLGPEGVEERQRQRDIRLSEWKEEHPPIGQTARGNYA
ncbi:hypothetical protein TraAM80_00747 [Trypanosoma rangeli]|uniref:TAP42-like family protein n=1 Tax=Trypanosoma rangeli TaxID=5698 RepID=A0A3R7MA47_TRYRA|nr:uncharacterized protein TraAM80_00747 [Trypanosoma rangeli]RNF11764.1 hypothetical protein TraAM80_00747 [Trypanosoma rangeli]|eukprot:RNF11764.1 hypothetical protein TraAM80_00747 [Trypanosoma rangeli]